MTTPQQHNHTSLEADIAATKPTMPAAVNTRLQNEIEHEMTSPSGKGGRPGPVTKVLDRKRWLLLLVALLAFAVAAVAWQSQSSDRPAYSTKQGEGVIADDGSLSGGASGGAGKDNRSSGVVGKPVPTSPTVGPTVDDSVSSIAPGEPSPTGSSSSDKAVKVPAVPTDKNPNAKLTADATLLVAHDEFSQAAADVYTAVDAHQGKVLDSTVQVTNPVSTASFSLQVPRAQYGPFMRQLSDIAKVTTSNQSLVDQGQVQTDLGKQMTETKATIARLRQQIKKASGYTKISLQQQLTAAEKQLADAQEQLQTNRQSVTMVDVQVSLQDKASLPAAAPATGFTVDHMLHIAKDIGQVVGSVLLLVVIVGFIPAVIVGLLVYRRRRRRQQAWKEN